MGVRIGVVSTHPPTQCGIATFAEALVTQLSRSGAYVGVVRVVDEPQVQVLPVVHQWVRGRPASTASAALVLDTFDTVLVQHEYGIFGGDDGEDVLDLLARVHVPVVTVLHTVLTHPTANQHRVLAGLVERSSVLVTMTRTARDRLIAGWDVDPADVVVIPHGAESTWRGRRPVAEPARRPMTVLTWGLLSPGKGVEWALRALAELDHGVDRPVYRIVGRTHPRVLERDGEAYRDGLRALAHELGIADRVVFVDRYLTRDELSAVIDDADVVLLPYDSREQVTSGVLTEAVAAGKPVISTAFPHAIELLSDGVGLLVPQGDHRAIAAALEQVTTDPVLVDEMAARARELSAGLLWPAVAECYLRVARSLTRSRLPSAV